MPHTSDKTDQNYQDDTLKIIEEFDAHCREREFILRETFPDFKIHNSQHHPPVPALDTVETDSIVSFIQALTPVQELGTVAYAAEAGQFAEGGFQSVICGPGSIAQAHRANEFIAKDQLDKGVEMLRKLIKKLS